MARAKRKPETNAAEFEAIASALDFGVLLLDSDVNIKFASTGAHKFFGSKDADQLKNEWRDYFDRLSLPDLALLEKNTAPFHHRIELQSEDLTRLLRVEIYPLRHGECDCYVMYVKDREVLNALDRELLHASYHYIQRYLISTLVHDLNAPINTMRITLELIERTLSPAVLGASEDVAAKWTRYKNILAEELGKLKSQVADIPKLFETVGDSVPVPFDVRHVVEGVGTFLKHETASKNIRRATDLPEHPITMVGRPAELKLALLNLAAILVDAMKQGGRLHLGVSAKQDTVDIVLHGDAVEVDQFAAFDYEKLTFSSKEKNLGMFVARLIVEAHGGEVLVKNSADNGWVTLQVLLPSQFRA